MLEQCLSKFEKNKEGLYEVYDRFTFDDFFKVLLENDFDYEEALDFILCNCSLSAIIFQERIYNNYYLNISTDEAISDDLIDLRNQIFSEILANKYLDNGVGLIEIAEQDCINYKKEVAINRTFEGDQTICGQLQDILGVSVKSAPDEWKRLYNVDCFIEVNDKYIGLQIKPITFEHTVED